ncbi:MAG: SDR family oxidoreductase [Nitrospirae bacterium]|nr:SDR family oxidoreductase [Nitrospirota bacterium]
MTEKSEFNGSVAIITGASRGIGAAIARAFSENGANLVLGYLNESEEQKTTAASINNAIWIQGNTSDIETSKKLCNAAIERWGRIDIVVANAGISHFGKLIKMSDEDFDNIIKINQYGVFYLLKECGRIMKKSRHGSIVTISSSAASKTPKMMAVYAATKAFIEALTRGLALELGEYGVRVNSVAPGVTDTEMNRVMLSTSRKMVEDGISVKRIATPEEIAHAVLFLCSNKSSFINGHILKVDGGSTQGL